MFKQIFVITLLCFLSSSVTARQSVEIVSRFGPAATTGRFAIEYTKILNEIQNEFEFRITSVVGASGEVADQRALALARLGTDVLVYGSSSSLGFNRYTKFGNSFNRDLDLIPLQGLAGIPFAIQIPPDSKIDTLDQLVASIKNKPQAYHATTISSSTSKFFDNLFRHTYNLDNVKQLSYAGPLDITRSMLQSEADYTIYNYADAVGLKLLVVSDIERVSKFPNVPTGKEVGFDEFNFSTLSMISVPKERAEFGKIVIKYLTEACKHPRMVELISKTNYNHNCIGTDNIWKKVRDELKLIEKYKQFLD